MNSHFPHPCLYSYLIQVKFHDHEVIPKQHIMTDQGQPKKVKVRNFFWQTMYGYISWHTYKQTWQQSHFCKSTNNGKSLMNSTKSFGTLNTKVEVVGRGRAVVTPPDTLVRWSCNKSDHVSLAVLQTGDTEVGELGQTSAELG